MSRRSGQRGHIEESGNMNVVRFRIEVPGQSTRQLVRVPICPINGPGALGKAELRRKATEIVNASGANSESRFQEVVSSPQVTFTEQSQSFLSDAVSRARDPIANSTLRLWNGILKNWLLPLIGALLISQITNKTLKIVVARMRNGFLPRI